jgi:hypothetical protein
MDAFLLLAFPNAFLCQSSGIRRLDRHQAISVILAFAICKNAVIGPRVALTRWLGVGNDDGV